MNLVPEIKKLIAEAAKQSDINRLLDINLRVSGYLVYLNESEEDAHRYYLQAYNARKMFEGEYIIGYDGTATKAQAEANVKSKSLRIEEMETEIVWNRIKGFRYQVNQFVEVLKQKIAHLRWEFENTRKQV